MAMRLTYIDPYSSFDYLYSFLPVLMAIFGGIGYFYGPMIGAAIFAVLEDYLITQYAEYYRLIIGATLVLAIMYMPEGLVGFIGRTWLRLFGGRHAHT
jgi:branched-chain amino acid transport system permease protein